MEFRENDDGKKENSPDDATGVKECSNDAVSQAAKCAAATSSASAASGGMSDDNQEDLTSFHVSGPTLVHHDEEIDSVSRNENPSFADVKADSNQKFLVVRQFVCKLVASGLLDFSTSVSELPDNRR